MSYVLVSLLRCQLLQRGWRCVRHIPAWFKSGKERVLFCTQVKLIQVTTRLHLINFYLDESM
jgi:hypothetical protein